MLLHTAGARKNDEGGGRRAIKLAYLVPVRLVRLLRKPRYPEDLGGLQETAEGTLVHVHFPVIDELDQRVQVAERYVLKYYHRVFTRRALRKRGGRRGGTEETRSRISSNVDAARSTIDRRVELGGGSGTERTRRDESRRGKERSRDETARQESRRESEVEEGKKETGSYLEQLSEVGTACRKYDAVRFEALAIAGQCDVHEILIVPQVLKRGRDAALVIVPSQAKVLRIYHRYIYSPIIRNNERYLNLCRLRPLILSLNKILCLGRERLNQGTVFFISLPLPTGAFFFNWARLVARARALAQPGDGEARKYVFSSCTINRGSISLKTDNFSITIVSKRQKRNETLLQHERAPLQVRALARLDRDTGRGAPTKGRKPVAIDRNSSSW